MAFEYTPYILPLIAAAMVTIVVMGYAWLHRSTNGAKALALIAASITLWLLGYALEVAGSNLETKFFWGAAQYIGIASAPYFWMIFGYQYSGRDRKSSRTFVLATAVIPIITILLALTTRWHGLIWNEYFIARQGDFTSLGVGHGPWFWVHFAYSYLSLLIGSILLGRLLLRRQEMYRGQAISLLVAVLTPWVGNALYLTGNSPIPNLDLTPFAFTITAAALAWAVFGFRLVDISPLAREQVIDSMQDGMVVLNRRGNLVDINPAAERMLGVTAIMALGKEAAEIFAPWPHLLERFRSVTETNEEIVVGSGNAQLRYLLRISTLLDPRQQPAGRVLMIHPLGETSSRGSAPVETVQRVAVPPSALPPSESIPPTSTSSFWGQITSFFRVPLKFDLPTPEGANPSWYRTRERIFTVITRLAAVIGTVSLITVIRAMSTSVDPLLPFGIILILLFVLGLARTIQYEIRIGVFLFLIYGFGFIEALNYGYSVECFIFFMSFVVTSAVMTSRRGAITAFLVAFITLGAFAGLIGSQSFIPLVAKAYGDAPVPATVQTGITSLVVFAAGMSSVVAAITILLENVQTSWQKETQALNLLQQERDLLDQRVTERTYELQSAEIKYRTLVERLPVVVYRDAADESATNSYMSPQIQTLLGYPQTEWEHDPNLWEKLIHPEDRASVMATIGDTLHHGTSVAEYRLLARDGRTVWVRDEGTLVRDENGQPLYVQGILEDITARRKAEEQLRKLSRVVEQSSSSIVITDVNGVIEYVNPHFTKASGYTSEEAVGKRPNIIKSGRQSLDFYQEMWQTISAGQTWRGVFHNQHKDGTLFWESATITPVHSPDGVVTHYVAIEDDITHQKEMEEALQQSYQNQSVLNSLLNIALENLSLDAMLERALDIILTTPWLPTQPQGGIFLVERQPGILVLKAQRNLNNALLTMCALVPFGHCLCGQAAANARIEFADCVDDRHENQYEGIQPHGHYNVPILFRDEVLGVLVLYLDVGRVREPREVTFLEAIGNTLAAMIRDKQAEEALAQARDQALEASRFKSQLLSRVSHELRTPLGGILGYAELLQSQIYGPLTTSQDEALGNVIESTHYLTGMVNDLLDEAQAEAGALVLYPEVFEPASLLNKIEPALSVLASKKGLAFYARITPEVPEKLYGDVHRLQQIIVNLVGNAVKFTAQGEVCVTVTRPASAQWAIEVRDTGAGIAETEQQTIFEPFRQVSNAISRENRGSGLGLAIVKHLIELMGGRITLDSEIGKGSVFTVFLPITNAPGA